MIMQVNAKVNGYAKDEYERMQISADEYITAYDSKYWSKMNPKNNIKQDSLCYIKTQFSF